MEYFYAFFRQYANQSPQECYISRWKDRQGCIYTSQKPHFDSVYIYNLSAILSSLKWKCSHCRCLAHKHQSNFDFSKRIAAFLCWRNSRTFDLQAFFSSSFDLCRLSRWFSIVLIFSAELSSQKCDYAYYIFWSESSSSKRTDTSHQLHSCKARELPASLRDWEKALALVYA